MEDVKSRDAHVVNDAQVRTFLLERLMQFHNGLGVRRYHTLANVYKKVAAGQDQAWETKPRILFIERGL